LIIDDDMSERAGIGVGSGDGAGTGTGDSRAGGVPAHGGRREDAERRFGIPKEELLDFSASINLLGPSPSVMAAVRSAAVDLHYYPEEGAGEFTRLVADYLGVLPDEIVPGNGSIEVIYWLARALTPRRVLIVEPTFSEYRRACEAVGADCDSLMLLEEENFILDAGRIEPEGYDLVFLCNPNNPTGGFVSRESVTALWKRCREAGAGLVVDEAFIDFKDSEESALYYGVREGMYVVRSFTKSHSLAGLRLGCLVAEAGFAGKLRAMMPPWNLNSFALAAGRAALTEWDYMELSRRENADARARLRADLAAIPGIEPLPSVTNFLLCRLEEESSAMLAEWLGWQGILVRDCRSFAGLGDRYVRVAVRGERDNYQLVAALRKAFI